jgi:hypothetical protein
MAWTCGECGGIAGQTETEALEHGEHCGEAQTAPDEVPGALQGDVGVDSSEGLAGLTARYDEWNARQTAALELIAVNLGHITKHMERMAYRPRTWAGQGWT